jgi:hypothetical protein
MPQRLRLNQQTEQRGREVATAVMRTSFPKASSRMSIQCAVHVSSKPTSLDSWMAKALAKGLIKSSLPGVISGRVIVSTRSVREGKVKSPPSAAASAKSAHDEEREMCVHNARTSTARRCSIRAGECTE